MTEVVGSPNPKMRSWAYGLAGVTFVLILSLIQVWKNILSLNISLYAAAVSLPTWLFLASTIDDWIRIEKPLADQPTIKRISYYLMGAFTFGGASLWIAIGAVINYASVGASIAFGLSSVFAFIVTVNSYHWIKWGSLKKKL